MTTRKSSGKGVPAPEAENKPNPESEKVLRKRGAIAEREKLLDEFGLCFIQAAGKYGSLGKSGQSYTEMEYRFAVDIGKLVIAFLHKDISTLSAAQNESTEDGRAKLKALHELLKLKMCKFWDSPVDLGSKVSRSLVQPIKSTPATGWIRADQATDALAAAEFLRLRNRIEEVEGKLAEARTAAPPERKAVSG
jgi:hypothetical protein